MMPGIIVIGASLGGLRALNLVLGNLPKDFRLPIVIVQHRSNELDASLVKQLQQSCKLRVSEAEDKEDIIAGRVYVAPAGYHLLIDSSLFCLSVDQPVLHARPSIDVAFESAADAFGSRTIGVVLTGASNDGAKGAALIKTRGGTIIVEDPVSAECATMPAAAIKSVGTVDAILPLPEIAPFLLKLSLRNGDRKDE
ncbi:MAG: chemotaxis protein CheB [Deltaproteobacteria bacterium]|nr:chemotaxis protein CheB [Deltaproteobacteria bacterium]